MLAAVTMAGCTPGPDEQTADDTSASATAHPGDARPLPTDSPLAPGRYVVSVADAPSAPLLPVLSVPDGYEAIGDGIGVGADDLARYLWVWDVNRATIQYNESHHNQTSSTADGGGFDLDGGVTNSIVQYNYSHDNAGPGYGVFQFSGARPFHDNTVRYNVSANDARKNNYGAIAFWNGGSGIKAVDVYNNTVYLSPSGTTIPKAIQFQSATTNVQPGSARTARRTTLGICSAPPPRVAHRPDTTPPGTYSGRNRPLLTQASHHAQPCAVQMR